MDSIEIKQIRKIDEEPSLWKLLLSADPSKELIEQYLPASKIYVALLNRKIVGEYVLTTISSDVLELKNIAVDENYQHQGIGKQLILDAIHKAKEEGVKKIEVGTGNDTFQQSLYQKCGFQIIGIDKDFFKKYYKEEIIENGVTVTDMIRLAIKL